ncbi:MAG: aminodeoxychorismate lyase [Woeseiaceae bacterium]
MSSPSTTMIDRAAAYGDGVFETIAIRNAEPRFWAAHRQRLRTSCERLGLPCPTNDELTDLLTRQIDAAADLAEFATARLVLSAGATPRGYARSPNRDSEVSISVFAARPVERNLIEEGARLRICSLRLAIQPALAGIKSLNRLEQVLARSEWDDSNTFEGLMLDTGGRLICGTMSNVFIVKDSLLLTPEITRCGVSGIMRAQVLQRLQENGVTCEVRDVVPEELQTATEVFLTNSQFGVVPVRQIDKQQLRVGAVSRQVQTLMAAAGVPECLV